MPIAAEGLFKNRFGACVVVKGAITRRSAKQKDSRAGPNSLSKMLSSRDQDVVMSFSTTALWAFQAGLVMLSAAHEIQAGTLTVAAKISYMAFWRFLGGLPCLSSCGDRKPLKEASQGGT